MKKLLLVFFVYLLSISGVQADINPLMCKRTCVEENDCSRCLRDCNPATGSPEDQDKFKSLGVLKAYNTCLEQKQQAELIKQCVPACNNCTSDALDTICLDPCSSVQNNEEVEGPYQACQTAQNQYQAAQAAQQCTTSCTPVSQCTTQGAVDTCNNSCQDVTDGDATTSQQNCQDALSNYQACQSACENCSSKDDQDTCNTTCSQVDPSISTQTITGACHSDACKTLCAKDLCQTQAGVDACVALCPTQKASCQGILEAYQLTQATDKCQKGCANCNSQADVSYCQSACSGVEEKTSHPIITFCQTAAAQAETCLKDCSSCKTGTDVGNCTQNCKDSSQLQACKASALSNCQQICDTNTCDSQENYNACQSSCSQVPGTESLIQACQLAWNTVKAEGAEKVCADACSSCKKDVDYIACQKACMGAPNGQEMTHQCQVSVQAAEAQCKAACTSPKNDCQIQKDLTDCQNACTDTGNAQEMISQCQTKVNAVHNAEADTQCAAACSMPGNACQAPQDLTSCQLACKGASNEQLMTTRCQDSVIATQNTTAEKAAAAKKCKEGCTPPKNPCQTSQQLTDCRNACSGADNASNMIEQCQVNVEAAEKAAANCQEQCKFPDCVDSSENLEKCLKSCVAPNVPDARCTKKNIDLFGQCKFQDCENTSYGRDYGACPSQCAANCSLFPDLISSCKKYAIPPAGVIATCNAACAEGECKTEAQVNECKSKCNLRPEDIQSCPKNTPCTNNPGSCQSVATTYCKQVCNPKGCNVQANAEACKACTGITGVNVQPCQTAWEKFISNCQKVCNPAGCTVQANVDACKACTDVTGVDVQPCQQKWSQYEKCNQNSFCHTWLCHAACPAQCKPLFDNCSHVECPNGGTYPECFGVL